MSQMKRPSKIIAEAERRAAGLESIDPNLDLGNGYTLVAYRASIAATSTQENRYLMALAICDEERVKLKSMESGLAVQSDLYLKAVEVKHGRNSIEYKKAGGKLPGERRRSSRKPVAIASPAMPPATPPTSRAEDPKS